MSLSAAVLEKMLEKGLSLADAVEIAKLWEAGAEKTLSAGAIRTRRYRARLAAEADCVTGDVTVTRDGDERKGSRPPKENNPSPPLKGGISPGISGPLPAKPEPSAGEKPLSFWVSEIWKITPRPGRERSGKRDLENAVRAAMRRGADPAAIVSGVTAYYASPDATKDGGQYAKGVHIVISSGRWEAFAEPEPPPDPTPPSDPWPKRLREFRRNGFWNTTDWGPKPGKPGCLAPIEVSQEAAA